MGKAKALLRHLFIDIIIEALKWVIAHSPLGAIVSLVVALLGSIGDLSAAAIVVLSLSAFAIALIIIAAGVWLKDRVGRPASNESVTQEVAAATGGITVFERILVEGRRQDRLEIHKGSNPWVIWYPIHLYNGSNVEVDIVSYNLNLHLDYDSHAGRVTWKAPDSEASNGVSLRADGSPVTAISMTPGKPHALAVPISRRQISKLNGNPKWSAHGSIFLRCNGIDHRISYDISADSYQLHQADWVEWVSQ